MNFGNCIYPAIKLVSQLLLYEFKPMNPTKHQNPKHFNMNQDLMKRFFEESFVLTDTQIIVTNIRNRSIMDTEKGENIIYSKVR